LHPESLAGSIPEPAVKNKNDSGKKNINQLRIDRCPIEQDYYTNRDKQNRKDKQTIVHHRRELPQQTGRRVVIVTIGGHR